MRSIRLLSLLLLVCSYAPIAFSQDAQPLNGLTDEKADRLAQQYINEVTDKSEKTERALNDQTEKYLDLLEKNEIKLKRHLDRINPQAANSIFANSSAQYEELKNNFKNKSDKLLHNTGNYTGWLDTSGTAIKFLAANPLTGKLPATPAQIKDALSKVSGLEDEFKRTESVKAFITQRKAYLTQQLAKYNLGKELGKYKQTCYYYGAQVNEIKSSLQEPEKAERKALALLRQYSPFQNFMKKYGILSGLFDVPADYGTASLNGLQSINQVQSLLQAKINNLGPSGAQAVSASLCAAQSELSKLRNRFPGGGDATDIPDFRPQQVKTRPVKRRLVYGFDMSTTKANALIPSCTDLSLSIGYRLSDRLTTGLGCGYKLGLGPNIQHIHLSSQGAKFSTYLDWRIRRGYYLSTGGDVNYFSAFASIKELQNYSAWTAAALAGVSKTVNIKSKFLKNTRVSLLYNFLHASAPKTSAIIFKTGYNF